MLVRTTQYVCTTMARTIFRVSLRRCIGMQDSEAKEKLVANGIVETAYKNDHNMMMRV